ncbi:MAG TPA: HEAT repeat domain-containing protein [Planctomycetota bacterium]|jgi:HEAT repeat protein|nr:HEAT repeat domain-containing protein [Planctomycetota bacterium]
MNPLPAIALPLFLLLPQGGAAPPKDDDPVVAEAIEALKKAVKGKDDAAAIGVIDQLTQKAKGAGPKDRGKIASGVASSFDAVRVPVEGQNKSETFRLYVAAAVSLGTMKDEGVKPLLGAVDNRRFRHEVELRAAMVEAVGATKSPAAVKPLLDLLDDKDYPIIIAAAHALANYHDAKEPDRKRVAEVLVKQLESAHGQAEQNANEGEARRKYDAVGPSFMDALAKVTGEEIRQPQAWVKWWNDNKKKKW